MVFIHPLSLVSLSSPPTPGIPLLFIKSPYCFHVLKKINPLSLIKVACVSTGVREAVYWSIHTHCQLHS